MNNFDPVLISVIRRTMPSIIAEDISKVQPMFNPFGKEQYPYQCDVLEFSKFTYIIEMRRWCDETLQANEWASNSQFFAFTNEQSYSWFLLRWM